MAIRPSLSGPKRKGPNQGFVIDLSFNGRGNLVIDVAFPNGRAHFVVAGTYQMAFGDIVEDHRFARRPALLWRSGPSGSRWVEVLAVC